MRGRIFLMMLTATGVSGCGSAPPSDSAPARATQQDTFALARARMVEVQIKGEGIRDSAVLAAMNRVPRHRFVLAEYLQHAYADSPLPIGLEQTISQPYIVAYMTEAAMLSPSDKVLEIGTGSGYQAAVLAELVKDVYTIELLPELAQRAADVLKELGYANIHARTGDGYAGWKEHAPFDAILVTAAPDHVPPALVEQLAVNGRMVIPVGTDEQELRVLTKQSNGKVIEKRVLPVRFVPLVRPK